MPCPAADELGALQEVLGESGGQRDVVQRLLAKVAGLQGAVATAEATRRRLHNELVEVRGNVSCQQGFYSTILLYLSSGNQHGVCYQHG